VVDEFTLFYFRWIGGNRKSNFISLSESYWDEKASSQEYKVWVGYAFEGICYKHIKNIRRKLKIPATAIAYSWQYQPNGKGDHGAQIDLFFDRDDGVITLCEIKYSAKPFVIDKKYVKILQNKVLALKKSLKTNKQIFVTFISANGVKENMYSEELVTGVVTLDDLFES